MHKYYAQENGIIYYAITSRDARENDATQTSELSKYQIISQPSSCNIRPTANVRSDGRSFPRSNADQSSDADVCAADRQRRRRYSAADRTTRQSDVASDRAHRE